MEDVAGLYERLDREFGPDAVTLSDRSTTSSIMAVALDGSPLLIGWFQNQHKRGAPAGGVDCYAVTAIPDHARTVFRRTVISQELGDPLARVTDEDWEEYMEGLSDYYETLGFTVVGQPELTDLLRTETEGAVVLDTDQAREFNTVRLREPVEKVRAYGRALLASGGMGRITFE